MLTYTTLDGQSLDLSGLSPVEREHFDRCYIAYRADLSWAAFGELVTGNANPAVRAAGGWVTPAVGAHPLYQAIRDLEDRLGIRQGEIGAEEGDDLDRDPVADNAQRGSRRTRTAQRARAHS